MASTNNIAIGSGLMPHSLIIDTSLITLKQKEMDIELTIDSSRLKDIDTIVINGFKYVKVKD